MQRRKLIPGVAEVRTNRRSQKRVASTSGLAPIRQVQYRVPKSLRTSTHQFKEEFMIEVAHVSRKFSIRFTPS